MDERVVKLALLEAVASVLEDAGIQVDVEKGVISWPDPVVVPFDHIPIDPNRLMKLGRAFRAARLCWPEGGAASGGFPPPEPFVAKPGDTTGELRQVAGLEEVAEIGRASAQRLRDSLRPEEGFHPDGSVCDC